MPPIIVADWNHAFKPHPSVNYEIGHIDNFGLGGSSFFSDFDEVANILPERSTHRHGYPYNLILNHPEWITITDPIKAGHG